MFPSVNCLLSWQLKWSRRHLVSTCLDTCIIYTRVWSSIDSFQGKQLLGKFQCVLNNAQPSKCQGHWRVFACVCWWPGPRFVEMTTIPTNGLVISRFAGSIEVKERNGTAATSLNEPPVSCQTMSQWERGSDIGSWLVYAEGKVKVYQQCGISTKPVWQSVTGRVIALWWRLIVLPWCSLRKLPTIPFKCLIPDCRLHGMERVLAKVMSHINWPHLSANWCSASAHCRQWNDWNH